jgi:HAD superfamily hydrolase (TIGR01509 family)
MARSAGSGALLFDLDGTLLRSDPLHEAVFAELLAEYGIALAPGDYFRHILGRTNAAIFGHFLPDRDWQRLGDEKEARFRARLEQRVEPTPGLLPLLARAQDLGLGLAVVTNAPAANAEAMLSAIGCRDSFDTIVAAGGAPRGKPFPDPYLHALDRLGTAPAAALAFEDSTSGIAAAVAAGILTIGLAGTLDAGGLADAGARLAIQDFTDPALGPLLDRLTGAAA